MIGINGSFYLFILVILLSLCLREYVNQEDLTKAARKVAEAKKHESKSLLPTAYFLLCFNVFIFTAKMEYTA